MVKRDRPQQPFSDDDSPLPPLVVAPLQCRTLIIRI
jgi:hypothetical protein